VGLLSGIDLIWDPCGLNAFLCSLNVVLLPGAELPLHIFEPRYRAMSRPVLRRNWNSACFSHFPRVWHTSVARPRFLTSRSVTTTAAWTFIRSAARPPSCRTFSGESLLEGQVDYLEDRESPQVPVSSASSWSSSKPAILSSLTTTQRTSKALRRRTFPICGRDNCQWTSVEAANPRASLRGGSPGTSRSVPSRMGSASTEDRSDAPARRRKWTRIKLVVCEPARPARGTDAMTARTHAIFRTFQFAHSGELKRIPDFDPSGGSRSVKNEIRRNLLEPLKRREPLPWGARLRGHRNSSNHQCPALSAQFHSLGLRGQAKSRILRA